MKILIVEDNPASLKLVAEVLETAGMEVLRAGSAEEALSLLETFVADLVLTDVILPGIDGLSLARKLKSKPATQNIPIVAMTANLVCDDELARDAGCEALLQKPVSTRHLAQQLVEILNCAVHLRRLAATGQPVETPRPDPSAPPVQALVVEDDPTSLKLTSALLMMNGYIVSVATSAEQALLAISANPHDVIVLDLNLPRVTGLELLRALKRHSATQTIPILALTAYPRDYGRDSAFQAGCDAYLMKPLDTRRFPQQLDAILKAPAVVQLIS